MEKNEIFFINPFYIRITEQAPKQIEQKEINPTTQRITATQREKIATDNGDNQIKSC